GEMIEVDLGDVLFFVSSRRRHTRSKRDWSSDVCSSDLSPSTSCKSRWEVTSNSESMIFFIQASQRHPRPPRSVVGGSPLSHHARSEERRVGKECTSLRLTRNDIDS